MYIKAWRIKRDFTGNAKPCCDRGKAPVSPCKPLCARFRAGVACVPAFAHESERGPFVPEVLKSV